jgi:hypothetical protein
LSGELSGREDADIPGHLKIAFVASVLAAELIMTLQEPAFLGQTSVNDTVPVLAAVIFPAVQSVDSIGRSPRLAASIAPAALLARPGFDVRSLLGHN